jgi:alpha-1,2-glucosyltransferase
MRVGSEVCAYAGYAALCAFLHTLFARTVPHPYMDEPFHVGQSQAYCAGRWHEWDEKITTFPGLYYCAAAMAWARGGASDACALPKLRSLNLLPALATPWLLHRLLGTMHPETSRSDLWANVAVLTLLPTHFFFHFLYYTDSAATCSVLLLLLLHRRSLPTARSPSAERGIKGKRGSPMGSPQGQVAAAAAASFSSQSLLARGANQLGCACTAALAISFRQTNAVWVAFSVASATLLELHRTCHLFTTTARSSSIQMEVAELWRALPAALSTIVRQHLPQLLLLGAFVHFVFRNGGVVLGDKSNHQPSIHGAQMLYLTLYASAPYALEQLTVGLPRSLAAAGRSCRARPVCALFAFALVFLLAHLTRCHPFLLADNRHVTFYAWRYLLGRHWAVRYALAPVYLLLGHILYPAVWTEQGALLSVGLLLCAALVLVPSPLIEPRYLTLPALMLRLHAPPFAGARAWAPPLLLFGTVNAAMLALFLCRPYTWGDGSEARFMW